MQSREFCMNGLSENEMSLLILRTTTCVFGQDMKLMILRKLKVELPVCCALRLTVDGFIISAPCQPCLHSVRPSVVDRQHFHIYPAP